MTENVEEMEQGDDVVTIGDEKCTVLLSSNQNIEPSFVYERQRRDLGSIIEDLPGRDAFICPFTLTILVFWQLANEILHASLPCAKVFGLEFLTLASPSSFVL